VKMTADKNEKRDLFMISPSLSGEVPSRLLSSPEPGDSRVSTNFGLARAIGRYREGRSELPELFGFEPVVTASTTISVTNLLSGSINRTRSGSFTKSRFFASGT
jgi:hypothetical protein